MLWEATNKLKCRPEILTKNENVLTQWSVPQVGSIDKNRLKISLDCLFNIYSRTGT